ncbi:glycine N-acyltransferase-like protein 3 [Eriocheir sinensis]|uniref:glycine N-acyltransferase-like protein 3 n=1 Tax=Eriocheir sinensis TaxID=95602 RepID=UPI0021C81701|nr:glycine N-acyltransferase-like protein 3 [Eriocheir sinensis]
MAGSGEAGLRPVREEELEEVRERLARQLPHSIVVHGAVSLAKRYGLHTLRPASILVPACPQPSCLTVITNPTSSAMQTLVVFWNPEEDTARDVMDQLSRLAVLDWSQPVHFIAIPTALLDSIEAVGSVGSQRVRYSRQYPVHIYTLQTARTQDEGLPPEYVMASLKGSDATTVWTRWSLNAFDSLASTKHIITSFPSVGVYKREPSEPHQTKQSTNNPGSLEEGAERTLVSWTLLFKLGWIGHTFTLPQHRRRGLARAATQALARQLQFEGLLPYVLLWVGNDKSIKLHEGLGFRRQCEVHVLLAEPDQ